MSFSYVTYTGNGATQSYAVPFGFLDRDHVSVTLDGTPTTAFTWVNDGQITFNSAPASGVAIKIARDTPNTILVTISPKGRVQSADINTVFTQARYIAEEAYDNAVVDTSGPAAAAAASAAAAATSETNAATSASNAATSATNASNSETAAAASASAASTSETNAAASASSASTSASSASASATAAANSATAAAASASAASTSETNAAASQSAAATSATNAATSETNAAASASSASSSASSASASATSASDSLAATLAAYDNFDDRYLGAKASDPTLDNDGNALIAGALYFNTTAGVMKVYSGSAWVAAYVSGADFVPLLGGTMTGFLTLHADPSNALHAATKQYVDSAISGINLSGYLALAGGTMAGNLGMDNNQLLFGATPNVGLTKDISGTIKVTNGSPGVGAIEASGGLYLEAALTNESGLEYTSSNFEIVHAGTPFMRLTSTGNWRWKSNTHIGWSSGATGVATDTGLIRDAAGIIRVTNGSTGEGHGIAASWRVQAGATKYAELANTQLKMTSTYTIDWSGDGSADGVKDVGLTRSASGVLKVTNGSTGDGAILAGGGFRVDSNGTISLSGSTLVYNFDANDYMGYDRTANYLNFFIGGSVQFQVYSGGIEVQGEVKSTTTINTQVGTTYTLALTDRDRIVEMNNAAANTLTVPPNSSVAFPTGTRIDVVQYGAGQTTIAAGAGVTIRSKGGNLKLTGQYSGVTLYKRGTDEWGVIGDLTA